MHFRKKPANNNQDEHKNDEQQQEEHDNNNEKTQFPLLFDENGIAKIPERNGLMLRLDNSNGHLHVEYDEDGHFAQIHPNCFAPASLKDVRLLKGGGSGTAVFSGQYPRLHNTTVVMKHAGHKDTEEVMSLAGVHEQLLHRGTQRKLEGSSSNNNDDCDDDDYDLMEASAFLTNRIPQFLFCYISPRHVRDRATELWNTLRAKTMRDLTAQLRLILNQQEEYDSPCQTSNRLSDDSNASAIHQKDSHDDDPHGTFADRAFQAMKAKSLQRELWICRQSSCAVDNDEGGGSDEEENKEIDVHSGRVLLRFPSELSISTQGNCVLEKGYTFLGSFTTQLANEQEHRYWKCTLAQSRVGGPTSENGAAVLVSGRLHGKLLHKTIGDLIQVMKYLRQLSSPEERKGTIHVVRNEVRLLEAQVQAFQSDCSANTTTTSVKTKSGDAVVVTQVSKICNEFAGACIRKNFLPREGRFARLREYGEHFYFNTTLTASGRQQLLVLLDDEKLPATILGRLLRPACPLSNVFDDPPSPFCVLDHVEHDNKYYWLHVLQLATSFESHQVNDCIWTCGLTDAGLHNTFVCPDRGLELFDLGAPQLMPMPAFLTKFLMSFYHVLGMEEEPQQQQQQQQQRDDNSKNKQNHSGGWVCRFEVSKKKSNNNLHHNKKRHSNQNDELLLSLTRSTKSMLPNIHKAFEYTMKQMIDQVFEGDERVRELLLTYTVLQLLSDACFCLDRWDQKGGGRERVDDRNIHLGKWLWRSVWDFYIASNVYETLLIPQQNKNLNRK
ncbi:hypothetical protein ACA910_002970 [Epithemia clementina (nom. ined.)]